MIVMTSVSYTLINIPYLKLYLKQVLSNTGKKSSLILE